MFHWTNSIIVNCVSVQGELPCSIFSEWCYEIKSFPTALKHLKPSCVWMLPSTCSSAGGASSCLRRLASGSNERRRPPPHEEGWSWGHAADRLWSHLQCLRKTQSSASVKRKGLQQLLGNPLRCLFQPSDLWKRVTPLTLKTLVLSTIYQLLEAADLPHGHKWLGVKWHIKCHFPISQSLIWLNH